jgi:hypothetical protein
LTEGLTRQKTSETWTKQFFDFFEDIIKHELPNTGDVVDPGFEPRCEHPPNPDDPDFAIDFEAEVKRLGEYLQ